MLSKLIDMLSILFWLAAGFANLSTLFGFLSRLDWRLELFSHFRLQYVAGLGICAGLFLITGDLPGFFFSLTGFIVNLALLLPIYRARKSCLGLSAAYRIFFANIYGHNTSYDRISTAIRSANPDMILLVEVRPGHLAALEPQLSEYSYRLTQPKQDNFGVAIFSRLPLVDAEMKDFNGNSLPTLVAHLVLDGRLLTLIGTHPDAPKSSLRATQRVRHLVAVAQFAASQSGELLLVGDFNTTSWSHVFRDMLSISHLLDSRQGFGPQPSWPVDKPFLRIPIDHALHTPDVCILSRRLGPPIGSDHFPLIVDFNFQEKMSSNSHQNNG